MQAVKAREASTQAQTQAVDASIRQAEPVSQRRSASRPQESAPVLKAATGVLDPAPPSMKGRSQRPTPSGSAARKTPRSKPAAKSGTPGDTPRMVRSHEHEAILPDTQGYDHVNWLRLCAFALLCVILLVAGVYFFLRQTSPGQQMLAKNGREASASAYHEVGRGYMLDGSISRAVWALEVAQTKDPDNLEILIDLGKAYMAVNNPVGAETAFARAIHFWPDYPEPYRLLIDMMIEKERNYEALQLAERASAITKDEHFETIYNHMLPAMPTVSTLGGERFSQEFSVELFAEEGTTIYYSTSSEVDPIQEGIEYTEPIYLAEGVRRIRAVAYKDGMYSKEQSQVYTINKPTPDMPKASLQSGTYNSVRTVSLRAANTDVIAIYYTIDGTAPTRESKKYTDPITLRIGKTILRAIAENEEGKLSNELSVEYKCDGKVKSSMADEDTVGGLRLYKTTRSEFEAAHGTPLSEAMDGEDMLGTYTRLDYAFGYALFLDRDNGSEPILAELSISSTAFAGPRGTGIGSRMEDVLDAYRDEGGEENANGDRRIYSLTNGRLGLLTKLGENEYSLGYYCKLDNGQYIELSYHILDGLVVRMDWLQYDVAM